MPRKLPRIRVFAADSVQALPGLFPFRFSYFTLLLAWNPYVLTREQMVHLFQPLADRGLAYFCAWGNRCEEVHDAVDQCVIPREAQGGPLKYMTMTTWHEHEPLEDAVWFFQNLAIPSEAHVFADFERYAVAIGNPEFATRMEKVLRPPKRKRFVSIPMKVIPVHYNRVQRRPLQ
jgi:hypothetical protein